MSKYDSKYEACNMDNRVFNVNGRGLEMLKDALKLVFLQESFTARAVAYQIHPKKGMLLFWYEETGPAGITKFPAPLTADEAAGIVWAWLESEPDIECESWDANAQHDGSNSLGWRVFVEDWGHVNNHHGTICAIKPAYLWHGK